MAVGENPEPGQPLFVGEPERCGLCGVAGHTHDDHWLVAECVRRGWRVVYPGEAGYGDPPDPDVKTAHEQRILDAVDRCVVFDKRGRLDVEDDGSISEAVIAWREAKGRRT